MGYWDYEEPIWEPSEADELFDELKSKLIDSAKSSIKYDMESLKSRNEYLEKRNIELEKAAHAVDQKARDIEYKAQNLRREVEDEFYSKSIDELFKSRIENVDVWFADIVHHPLPKCEYCNDDRMRIYTFPDGFEIKQPCSCNKQISCYEPHLATLDTLKYCVKPSRYLSERKYYMADWRAYNPKGRYDDYGYSDFKIINIVDVFDDNTINLRKDLSYGERIGFKTKEECQKYCDWLNRSDK